MTAPPSSSTPGSVKLTADGTTTREAYRNFLCVRCGVKRYRPAGVMCEECFRIAHGMPALPEDPGGQPGQAQTSRDNHPRQKGRRR